MATNQIVIKEANGEMPHKVKIQQLREPKAEFVLTEFENKQRSFV